MIPKKLDEIFNKAPVLNEMANVRVLVCKLNEILDYLSDKEEDNLACCGGRVTEKDLEEYLSKDKEASKGEE